MGAQKAVAENTKPGYKRTSNGAKFVRFIKADGRRWQYPLNCTSDFQYSMGYCPDELRGSITLRAIISNL